MSSRRSGRRRRGTPGRRARPTGFCSPTLLDPAKAATAAPNFAYVPGVAGAPGLLTVRRTITNSSAGTITKAQVRITSLSEANGAPEPGVTTQPPAPAQLRVINPATTTSTFTIGGTAVTVQNLSVDSPASYNPATPSTGGGGLNTTLTIPLPSGLAPGASVSIALSFAVDGHGPYWFGYDVDASTAAGPLTVRHQPARSGTTTTIPPARTPAFPGHRAACPQRQRTRQPVMTPYGRRRSGWAWKNASPDAGTQISKRQELRQAARRQRAARGR